MSREWQTEGTSATDEPLWARFFVTNVLTQEVQRLRECLPWVMWSSSVNSELIEDITVPTCKGICCRNFSVSFCVYPNTKLSKNDYQRLRNIRSVINLLHLITLSEESGNRTFEMMEGGNVTFPERNEVHGTSGCEWLSARAPMNHWLFKQVLSMRRHF